MTRNLPRIMVECDLCGNEFYFETDTKDLSAHLELLGWQVEYTGEGRDICPNCALSRTRPEELVLWVTDAPRKRHVKALGVGELLEISGRGKVITLYTPPTMPPIGAILIYQMRVFEVEGAEFNGKWKRGDRIGCIVKQVLGEPLDELGKDG